MQKINKIIAVLFLIFAFTLSPLSFSNIFALSQTATVEDITGYQEWSQSRTVDKNVIVEPGATLVIGKGVEINFINQWINIDVKGSLFVRGTLNEPATIKTDLTGEANFSIIAETGSNVSIRNAEIINGGSIAQIIGNRITNTAVASNYKGAVQVNGGNVDIQNATFKNNLNAIIVDTSDASVRVNRSRFIDNSFDVEDGNSSSDFRYNWWGSADGPQQICYDYGTQHNCYYEKIYGGFNFSNWLAQSDFHDPVIIIPGIIGSWEKDGQMQLDPIMHTYDNLYAEFVANGYIPEKDLFTFPYEWRNSNIDNAKLLRDKINEIKQIANWPEVDVVAHSMGGLLTREYIESGYYQNDIDQLVTLGTPENGAPKAYPMWEAGQGFSGFDGLILKAIIWQETRKGGYGDIFNYIHNRPMASIQELLPNYNYLFDEKSSNLIATYPSGYPTNTFLNNLNNPTNVDKVKGIEFDKIIGKLNDNSSTISGFNIINVGMYPYWVNGYPSGFDNLTGDRGMRNGDGDGTVPLFSAESLNIRSDNTIYLNSAHTDLPTDAQSDVLELLTNTRPTSEVRHSLIKDILITQVFSPVDIQVIAPDGKRVGKDFATGNILNEIDGAYYSGYDTQNEFLTIPNPIDGQYRILTQGTGEGSYKIETTKISEDPANQNQAVESTGTINGTATIGQQSERDLEVMGNDVLDGDVTPAPTKATIDSIISDVNNYYNQGLIKTASENKFLLNKLAEIKIMIDGAKKTKDINNKIDDLVKQINLKNNNDIETQTKATITANLNSIKY